MTPQECRQVIKDMLKDIGLGKKIATIKNLEALTQLLKESEDYERIKDKYKGLNDMYDQSIKDRVSLIKQAGSIQKELARIKNIDWISILVGRIAQLQHDKNFKLNARMSGKNWTLINRLTETIISKINGGKK